MQFKDKVAIITGGTRGIGKEITLAFARQGANVTAVYHSNQEAAQEMLQTARALELPGRVEVKRASVSEYKDIKQIMYEIAGIIAFTRSIAEELGSYGIIVTGIAPGLVKTDMTDKLKAEALEEYIIKTGSKRLLTPQEVAARVLALATPDSRNLQGQTIIVK